MKQTHHGIHGICHVLDDILAPECGGGGGGGGDTQTDPKPSGLPRTGTGSKPAEEDA